MLGALAGMDRLWKDMPQHQQVAIANMIEAHASAIVTRIAVLTATNGRPKVLATLDSISAAEACKAVIALPKEAAAALIPFTKQTIAIHVVNAEYFQGEAAPAQIMPDQQPLPLPASGGGNGQTPPVPETSVAEPGVTRTITIGAEGGSGGAADSSGATGAQRPKNQLKRNSKQHTRANGAGPSTKRTGSPFQ